jgi:sigma-B regulation protein RsbU (phosphoserine phosphatase)
MQNRFTGMGESEEKLWIQAIVVAQGRRDRVLVSASVPCSPELLDSLTSALGPIQLTPFRPAPPGKREGAVLELYGRQFIPVPARQIASRRRALGPPANWLDRQVNGAATLEAVYDDPGEPEGTKVPVLASFSVRPSQLTRLLFASLGAVGDLIVTGLIVIALLFLFLEVAALITGIVLTRTITHAIADLYDATQHVRKGDFSHRVRLHRRDQLGVLAESFNAMTSSIAELIEEQRKRQRLENELSIAREVQEQLFPQQLPSLEGIQLAAVCRPARTVSGDYYDVIRLGPTRIGIAVADISGKGISAALLMASLQAALRSQALQDGHMRTDQLVARLNKHLFLNTSDDRYATFFYAVYDTATRKLSYTNAGHVAPFYVCDGQAIKLEEGGTVVGLFGDC